MADDTLEEITINVQAGAGTDGAAADSPEAGIDELNRQLAEERAARAQETSRATEAERRFNAERTERQRIERAATEHVTTARAAVDEAQYESVTNALSSAEREARELTQQKARLLSEGDFEKASELDLKIAELGGRLNTLRTGKTTMDEQRKLTPEQRNPQQQQRMPTPEEARENWLSQQTPANAAWIRSHADRFFGDQQFQAKAIAASNHATAVKGFAQGSPEYFAHIEEAVGLRQAEQVSGEQRQQAPARQAPAAQPPARTTPAAAPSRGNPSAAPGERGGTAVTLTPEERQMARQTLTPDIIGAGKDPEVVFAQRKAELQREGKWR